MTTGSRKLDSLASALHPIGRLGPNESPPPASTGIAPDTAAYTAQLARHAAAALGPDGTVRDRREAYHRFLRLEEHRVRLAHRGGAGGVAVARRRAALIDYVVRRVLDGVLQTHRPAAGPVALPISLVAVGGYGRRELNPYSDVDLAFVHPDGPASVVTAAETLIKQVLAELNDLELELGAQSTLSVSGAVELANQDMRTKTSFLECRLLGGQPEWFADLRSQFEARCVRKFAEDYVAARMTDQAKRHQRYGMVVSMQEPNVKNGCGGLRDYQNLLWVSFFKAGARSVAELVTQGLLSPREGRQLDEAYDFLMRVRNDLHYLVRSKVCSDVLTLELQPVVARNLGYPQTTDTRRLEAFMHDYYLHARNIFHLSETLTERLALKSPTRRAGAPVLDWLLRRKPAATPGDDGVHCVEGFLYPAGEDVFDQDPGRMLRVFRQALERPAQLGAEMRQLIRRKLPLIRGDFLESRTAAAEFTRLLAAPGGVGRALRLMHEVDFLGRFVPEFKGLTCLPQHDYAHRYTADEHTLVCLEKLDGLRTSTVKQDQPYRALLARLEDPLVLHLALLLHDTGKATGARSSTEASALMAQSVCQRLHLSPARRRAVTFLVDHQHTLLLTALHRDLEDPSATAAFAGIVGSPANLDALVLFSWADALGTDEQSWTDWKDMLVWQLYDATTRHLAGTAAAARRTCDRNALNQRLAEQLPPDFAEEIAAHLSYLPDRYFTAHSEAAIRTHIELFREFLVQREADEAQALAPAYRIVPRPDQGHWEVMIGGWNRRDFFTKIAGCLSAARLNILTAEVYAREDSLALATLRVTGADGRLPRHLQAWEGAASLLRRALGPESLDLEPLLRAAAPADPLRRPTRTDFPSRIQVSNDAHADFTLVEVQAPDRLGLLHDLLRAFDQLGLRVSLSHISTDKGAARDSFFVMEPGHHRVVARERIAAIQRALGNAIYPP